MPTDMPSNIKLISKTNNENGNTRHNCKICGKLFECKGFPKRVRMDCLCRRIYLCDTHKASNHV